MSQKSQLKTPQDIQDDIFRNMSDDEKVKLGSDFWLLAKDLVGDKIDYGKNRPASSPNKDSRHP